MKLLRIGVANFRSIGAQSVMIDLQKRINLLIGANNSGKSNVLEIVQRLGAGNNRFTNINLENIDLHRRKAGINGRFNALLHIGKSAAFGNRFTSV